MKNILIILILLGPVSLLGQFTKEFTNVLEYRFSNELDAAVETESYNYGVRMLDSILLYTDSPDKSVIKDGVVCCVKTYKKEKLQNLIKLAKSNNCALSSREELVRSVYPEIVKSNPGVFSFKPDSIKLFSVGQELAQMLVDDQVCRGVHWQPFVDHSEKLGYKVSVDHEKTGAVVDSVNTILLDAILDNHPQLSIDDVGKWGMITVFSVIQHSSSLKKYQQLMDRWYKNGDIPAGNFALYTDRVLVDENKPQIYGTQLATVNEEVMFVPIDDIDRIEENRMKMGLISIERYAKIFGIVWGDYYESQKNKLRP